MITMQNIDTFELRSEELDLKGQTLDINHAEPLEEIFKRVRFNKVNLEATSLDDEVFLLIKNLIKNSNFF